MCPVSFNVHNILVHRYGLLIKTNDTQSLYSVSVSFPIFDIWEHYMNLSKTDNDIHYSKNFIHMTQSFGQDENKV